MGDKAGKGKKKVDYTDVVVLNTDLHCMGCALKIKGKAKGHKGVEKVEVDMDSNNVTVKGSFKSSELHQHLESKCPRKNFKIVSDQHNPKEKRTVVLNVRLDCNGCIQTAKSIKGHVKGVEEVVVDAESDKVTVTGTMEEDSLVRYVRDNLKRQVEVVPARGGNR